MTRKEFKKCVLCLYIYKIFEEITSKVLHSLQLFSAWNFLSLINMLLTIFASCIGISWALQVHKLHEHYMFICIRLPPLLVPYPSSMLDKYQSHYIFISLSCILHKVGLTTEMTELNWTEQRCYSYIYICFLSIVKCFWYNLEKIWWKAFICEKITQTEKYIWHSSLYVIDFKLNAHYWCS